MLTFDEFYRAAIPNPEQRFVGVLLSLDPGETTGLALFGCDTTSVKLLKAWQIPCNPISTGIDNLTKTLQETNPDRLVYEDYKVYSWKSASHSWASLHTPQLIGCLETLSRQSKIPSSKELAQQPKAFVTDSKLHDWGFYSHVKGLKHAKDAVRHGIFYLIFRYPRAVHQRKEVAKTIVKNSLGQP